MHLLTWNMQGVNATAENKWNVMVANLILQLQLDVVCLQECGAPPPSAQLIQQNINGIPNFNLYSWGTDRDPRLILYYLSDPNGNRVNMGMVLMMAPQAITNYMLMYPQQAPVWRPVIGVESAGSIYLDIHAISPGGPDAPGLLEAVAAAAGNDYNWVIAGDFNREPDTLNSDHWEVCWPNGNTYSVTNPQSRYDYCARNVGSPDITGSVVTSVVFSDHFPVFYAL